DDDRPRRGVSRARRSPAGLDAGRAALRPRHERAAAEPTGDPDVHPGADPLQHPAAPGDHALRVPTRSGSDPRRPPVVAPMIIVMSHSATKAEIDAVVERIEEIGLKAELSRGEERTVLGVIGGNAYAYRDAFSHLGGIQEIIPITKPFKLSSRAFRPHDTVVDAGVLKIGDDEVVIMAGPCSVEGEEMLLETARHVAAQCA